jgi:hypothetical protein
VHQGVAASTLDGHRFFILTTSSSVNFPHCWPLLLILQHNATASETRQAGD